MKRWPSTAGATLALALACGTAQAGLLEPCRLKGVAFEAQCGHITRALDPAQPGGTSIEIHFAVLPALARTKLPDPLLFFAGGPGQSAIDLAGPLAHALQRLNNRRDIILIDQRGTGRSAPLDCGSTAATAPLRDSADPQRQVAQMQRCHATLLKLPYIHADADLGLFTTVLASQDANAVRMALGAARVNLMGGSYGTRAALDYMRQFPQTVRRTVIDGVAPPDMGLPYTSSVDNQAAFDAMLSACESEPACQTSFPQLRAQWQRLLAALPIEARVAHPLTGELDSLTITRDMVLALARLPLYMPTLAAGLPAALSQAAAGHFEGLVGLASAMGGRARDGGLAQGMHFSVVCAEDLNQTDKGAAPPGADFAQTNALLYRQVCAQWPRGPVPAAFYTLPAAPAATLVLSGGLDPVTPPRHGARVAQALGPLARHEVVANAGHGVSSLPCMRDSIYRFFVAETDADALKVDTRCARDVPRPLAFKPIRAVDKP